MRQPPAHPCARHKHPSLKTPIPLGRFVAEFRALERRAGLRRGRIIVHEGLTKLHSRNERRYAQYDPSAHAYEFGAQVLWLPLWHRIGLIAHELGHALAGRPGEPEADRAALERLGLAICYDGRWPGRGLQFVRL